jgi:hypothetical protein
MAEPGPAAPARRRERLVALLLLGVAVVLMLSSLTWFGTGQTGVGMGQLFLGVVLAALGFFLYRRATSA